MKRILLRNALPDDVAIIEKMNRIQNQRDGTNYPIPPFFNSDGSLRASIPVALIGHLNGMTSNALYVQRTGELMFAGCDPKATAFARRDIDALATLLTWQGYGDLYCHVPESRVKSIRKPLEAAGFDNIMERKIPLVTFYKDLRKVG